MVCTGILVCFALFRAAKGFAVPTRIMAAILCLFVLLCGVNALTVKGMEKNGVENNEKYRLVEVLRENGFTHGYATFWNSQVITLLSDSEVSTANVDINENGIAPCYYQTDKNQFEPQSGVEKYFVLMSDYEMSVLQQTADWTFFELLSTEIINVDGYKYGSSAQVWTIGGCELTDYNTVEEKDKVAPKTTTMKMKRKNTNYTFPKYSYTVITLKK
jgi:hypothetical protein